MAAPRGMPSPPGARGAWTGSLLSAALALALAGCFAPRVEPFTTDSEAYLDVARNLLAGDGLVQRVVDFWRPSNPDPLGLWPPGYPLAVALSARLGLDPESAARAVSVVAFVAFAVAFHALARRTAGAGWGALAVALALTTPRVARAGVMAWSEMLYLALATAGLLSLARVVESPAHASGAERTGPSRAAAAVAGLAVGLAATTRYIGLLLIPLGLAAGARAPVRGTSRALWLAGAALLPALWLAYNLARFGSVTGPGLAASDRDLLTILRGVGAGLRWGLLPYGWSDHAAVAAVALLALVAALVVAVRRGGASALVAGYAVLYLVALVGLRALANFNDVGDRYLLPLDPYLWLVAAVGLAALDGRGAIARPVARTVAVALVIGAVAGLGRALMSDTPAGTSSRSAELAALRQLLPADGPPVLSDVGHRVRSATGRAAVQIPPPRFRVREFTADDERRWRAAGVREAVLRRWHPLAPTALGEHLAARITGGGWTVLDSTADFVRYRLP